MYVSTDTLTKNKVFSPYRKPSQQTEERGQQTAQCITHRWILYVHYDHLSLRKHSSLRNG